MMSRLRRPLPFLYYILVYSAPSSFSRQWLTSSYTRSLRQLGYFNCIVLYILCITFLKLNFNISLVSICRA